MTFHVYRCNFNWGSKATWAYSAYLATQNHKPKEAGKAFKTISSELGPAIC